MKKPFSPASRQVPQASLSAEPVDVDTVIRRLIADSASEESADGMQDVADLMSQENTPWLKELAVMRHFAEQDYGSRVFVWSKKADATGLAWVCEGLRGVGHATLPNGRWCLDQIGTWQDAACPDSVSVATWTLKLRGPGKPQLIVVARHSNGLCAVYALAASGLQRIPLRGEAAAALVESVVASQAWDDKAWASCAARVLHQLNKDEGSLRELVARCQGDVDELAKGLSSMLIDTACSAEFLTAMVNVLQDAADPWVHEAQDLLSLLVRTIERSQASAKRAEDQVRKESAATIKRLQSSLEKQRMLYEGMVAARDRQAKELASMKQQLRAQNSQPSANSVRALHLLVEGC